MITQYKAADPLDPTSQAEYKLLAGGATRTWVGTEDAYNAEKNNIPNNTMICIIDDDMDVVADVYSTTETKTNKVWIDGKPIYRIIKTGSANFDNINWTRIQVFNDNIPKTIISYSITNEPLALRLEHINITNNIGFSTSTDTGNGSSATNVPYILILEYTKKTD